MSEWSIRPTDADTQILLDISLASQIKFSLLSPWGYERLVDEEQIPPEELVKHLTRIYFQGIAAD